MGRIEEYRKHLHAMATAETLEELQASKIWALSCIDNMKLSAKDAADMETTVKVFEYKSKKRFM